MIALLSYLGVVACLWDDFVVGVGGGSLLRVTSDCAAWEDNVVPGKCSTPLSSPFRLISFDVNQFEIKKQYMGDREGEKKRNNTWALPVKTVWQLRAFETTGPPAHPPWPGSFFIDFCIVRLYLRHFLLLVNSIYWILFERKIKQLSWAGSVLSKNCDLDPCFCELLQENTNYVIYLEFCHCFYYL